MSDPKTEKLFRKAVSAVKAKKGRGLVFGNSIPNDHADMNKDAFIKMILANVKTGKWLSGTFRVEGHQIGVKAYGLWVQRLVRPDLSSAYHDSGMFIKTQKALREWLDKSLTQLGIGGGHTFGVTLRPRKILQLAAQMVKNPSTKSWLRNDEYGTWERMAESLIESTTIKARELSLSEEQWDREIASILGLRALQASLEHVKKKGK